MVDFRKCAMLTFLKVVVGTLRSARFEAAGDRPCNSLDYGADEILEGNWPFCFRLILADSDTQSERYDIIRGMKQKRTDWKNRKSIEQ